MLYVIIWLTCPLTLKYLWQLDTAVIVWRIKFIDRRSSCYVGCNDSLLFKLKSFLPAPYYIIIKLYLEEIFFSVRNGSSMSAYHIIKADVPRVATSISLTLQYIYPRFFINYKYYSSYLGWWHSNFIVK
jgi:hypothetical protein